MHYYVKGNDISRNLTYSKLWANFKAVTLLWRNILGHSMEQQNDAISVWISCSCLNCCLWTVRLHMSHKI